MYNMYNNVCMIPASNQSAQKTLLFGLFERDPVSDTLHFCWFVYGWMSNNKSSIKLNS